MYYILVFVGWFVVCWLCFTSHRQRGHLETAPPFTVPCEGYEARLIHRSHWELNHEPSHSSSIPVTYKLRNVFSSIEIVIKYKLTK